MLNLNLNTLYTSRVTIEPILSNTFNYFLIGGGGGGASGAAGGKGGEGGKILTGSFDFPHLSTVTLQVGGGGVSGTTSGATGDNGVSSSLSNDSGLIGYASGGLANFNASTSSQSHNYTQVGFDYDYYNSSIWAGDGTKGSDAPELFSGTGGGANANNDFPWTTDPSPAGIPGLVHTGGGAGGFQYNEFNGGGDLNGASGLVVLSFLDPRNVFDYTGDWDLLLYLNGRKYFYWLREPIVGTASNGTFTFLGKKG